MRSPQAVTMTEIIHVEHTHQLPSGRVVLAKDAQSAIDWFKTYYGYEPDKCWVFTNTMGEQYKFEVEKSVQK